jgi:hypothetical protein
LPLDIAFDFEPYTSARVHRELVAHALSRAALVPTLKFQRKPLSS